MPHILSCRVHYFMGAKKVEIRPNGNGFVIGGGNGEGKTSTMRALIAALYGLKEAPDRIVTNGASHSEIVVELDNGMTVYREFDTERKQKLKVVGTSETKLQTMLDALFGPLAVDPGEFCSMEKEKRRALLQVLAGLDLSDLKKTHDIAVEERKLARRELETVTAKAVGRTKHKDVPAQEISVQEVSKQLAEAQEKNRARNQIVNECSTLNAEIAAKKRENMDLMGQIAALQQRIDANEARVLELRTTVEAKEFNLSKQPEIECDGLHIQIQNAEQINRKVRENADLEKLHAEIKTAEKRFNDFEDAIERCRKEKQKRLSEAKYPIIGLGIDDEDVTFNEIPFAQLAESEQLRVSAAIAFARNKDGVVFMRNAAGLDLNSRKLLFQWAEAAGVQLIIEVVDDQADVQILIEAGEVAADRLSPVEAAA